MDDDIPITPETIDEKQIAEILSEYRKLKITTKDFVEFCKKNGFEETDKITKEKYPLMMAGLKVLTK